MRPGAAMAKCLNIPQTLRLWLLCFFLLAPNCARAVDPNKHITQYAHTAWMIQDGFFKGSPTSIAQTKDGYLWIGTKSGLLRFDGVRFVPWTPEHGEQLPSLEIIRLLASRDGSLWIGTRAGLSHWRDQRLTNYPSTRHGVGSILQDDEGTIWFTQIVPTEGSGLLCRVLAFDVQCYGKSDGFPSFAVATALVKDVQGDFWIGGDTTLLRWKGGAKDIYRPPGLKSNAGMDGINCLAVSSEGTLWIGTQSGPGLGLSRLVGGQLLPFVTSGLDGSVLNVQALLADRTGALWVGTDDHGMYRIRGSHVDHFDTTDGLSSDLIFSFAEDHEGNLWVATSKGVDRFSDTPVVSFSEREGLGINVVESVLASRDGSVWVGGFGGLTNLRNDTARFVLGQKELHGRQVTSLLEDHTGRMWIGIDDTLSFYQKGVFHRIKRPDGRSIGVVLGLAEGVEGSIWAEVVGPPRTLLRIQHLTVREEHPEPQLPAARRVAADPMGGIWLGLLDGDLAHFQDGKLAIYQYLHDAVAQVYQLLPISNGAVLAATSYGVIGWRKGSLLTLTAKNGLPCEAVYAMTFDEQNNLWLFMDCEMAEVTNDQLQSWWNNPDVKLSIKTLDVFDGVRAGRTPFVAAARSSDGRLWFANSFLLQTIDPAHLSENKLPPPVHIEKIVADRKSYSPLNELVIPPLTRDFEIDYAGLSLVAPQKVRFRYKLEGRDKDWQDPGTRRQAFYSDLRPAKYRFRVIASNNDGVWNEEGAVLDFSVAPAWYQTTWFWALCLASAVTLLWFLYRLRVQQIGRAISTRFDERLGERTRIARELHDTFLQTVQGSKLVVDDALKNPGDHAGMLAAMEQLSPWLEQATQEGRAALNSLRISTTETNYLAGGLRRAVEECRMQASMEVSFSVVGDSKFMHPVVRDEIYRMGYEAIRNACTHSRGSRLEVELRYAQDLNLRVSDNGVGIDPFIADHGKEGHFGLQGMRERANRIGAKLTIVSSASTGTEIGIVVPGAIIFRKTSSNSTG